MSRVAKKRHASFTQQYAVSDDFYGIFQSEMKPLYLLAFLLTANHEQAERCLVAGLEDSVDGNRVFKEWAHSWARRNIIKNAIREVFPGQSQTIGVTEPAMPDPGMDPAIAAIARLPPVERFVFVMSGLEGYSDAECASLLRLSRKVVAEVRKRVSTSTTVRLPRRALAELWLWTRFGNPSSGVRSGTAVKQHRSWATISADSAPSAPDKHSTLQSTAVAQQTLRAGCSVNVESLVRAGNLSLMTGEPSMAAITIRTCEDESRQ